MVLDPPAIGITEIALFVVVELSNTTEEVGLVACEAGLETVLKTTERGWPTTSVWLNGTDEEEPEDDTDVDETAEDEGTLPETGVEEETGVVVGDVEATEEFAATWLWGAGTTTLVTLDSITLDVCVTTIAVPDEVAPCCRFAGRAARGRGKLQFGAIGHVAPNKAATCG